MRIVHFSETDLGGGAGMSSYRLHRALVARGLDSVFLVSRKFSTDPTVREAFPPRFSVVRRLLRERLDRLPLAFYPRRQQTDFSAPWLNWGLSRAAVREKADVIHLHWTNLGFMGPDELARFDQPVLWSLKDMWPFTGGCHYAGSCDHFTRNCGQCPVLGSPRERDLTRRQFLRKQALYRQVPFAYACLSRQALELAGTSPLLQGHRGHFLPIGVDLDRFKPVEQVVARRVLGLPETGFLVAFGALRLDDLRKGGDLVATMAERLAQRIDPTQVTFVTFGSGSAPAHFGPFKVHPLGLLRDETSMTLALAAANVTLVPSREDAGPSITIESLACGTPVVGYPVGTNRDLVESGKNGYLAQPFSADALADGVIWALGSQHDDAPRRAARESVKPNHDIGRQVEHYVDLYQLLLSTANRR